MSLALYLSRVRSNELLDGTPLRLLAIEIGPCFRAVELTDWNRLQRIELEVPHVYAKFSAWIGLYRFPMCDATATIASQGPYGLGTPNVCRRALWMACNLDGAGFVKRPQRAIATADGAIAVDERLREHRDDNPNRTTMTCACEHA
jgi:hypothetical protein